jgi:E1A/CREB-binding protein
MQRIKRNASYYTDPTKQNFWCETCFSRMKESEEITLDDGTITAKSNLLPAKHDSLPDESWIQCDDCKAHVHQICSLYNGRRTKSKTKFRCLKCTLKNREYGEQPTKYTNRACDLPTCKMSDSMEKGLQDTLSQEYRSRSSKLGVSIDEIEKANGLCIRVLSHIEKKHAVRELVSFSYIH